MISKKPLSWCRFGVISLFCGLAMTLWLGVGFWTAQSAEPEADPQEITPASASGPHDGEPQTGLPEAHIAIGKQVYQIEMAVTPQQAETGLMYRTSLPQGHGMLFPFKSPRPVSFWMKNTLIPLDILFIAQGHLLHVFENVQPCISEPCQTYGLTALTDMVLELPAGTALRDHLTAGSPVEVRLPVPAKPCPPTPISPPKGN